MSPSAEIIIIALWGAVMFYSAALVPYVSVGKPITKVTYKHSTRKTPCLLELTLNVHFIAGNRKKL